MTKKEIIELRKEARKEIAFYRDLAESNLMGITKFPESEAKDHYYSKRAAEVLRMLARTANRLADRLEKKEGQG